MRRWTLAFTLGIAAVLFGPAGAVAPAGSVPSFASSAGQASGGQAERTVSGEVVFADGTAVGGGRGRVITSLHADANLNPGQGFAPARYVSYGRDPSDGLPTSFELDQRGRFEITTTATRVAFEVAGDEFAVAFSEVVRTSERKPTHVRIEVDPGTELRGTVLDPDGNPVAGATVTIHPAIRDRSPDHLFVMHGEKPSGVSDEAGRFVVRGLGEQYRGVLVDHPEFVPLREYNLLRSTKPELELTQRPARWVTGRFVTTPGTDAAPDPVFPLERLRLDGVRGGFLEVAGDGSFRSVPMEPSAGQGVVAIEGFCPTTISWSAGTGKQDLGELTLDPGRTVAVQVFDDAGAPATGCEVQLEVRADGGNRFSPTDRDRTDHEGRAVLTGLNAASYAVVATQPGLAPARVEANAEQTRFLEIQLERLATLRGRVLDPDGEAVVGAAVRAYVWPAENEGGGGWVDTVSTRAEGRFELPGVLCAGKVAVYLEHARFPSTTHELAPIEVARTHDIDELRFSAGVELVGTVVNDAGEPVEDAVVSAVTNTFSGMSGIRLHPFDETDARGVFRIPGLLPGSYTLAAKDRGGRIGQATVETGEQDAIAIPVALQQTGKVSGRIVDGQGHPIGRAHVAAATGNRWTSSTTDSEGRFELSIAAGTTTLSITAEHDEYLDRTEQLAVSDFPRDLALTRGARAEVTLRVQGDRPLPTHVRVHLISSRGTASFPLAVENGRLLLRGRPAGRYEIRVLADDIAPTDPVPLELELGETTPAEILIDGTLEPVAIRVVGPDGEPRVNTRVRFSFDGTSYFGHGDTDQSGVLYSMVPHCASARMTVAPRGQDAVQWKDLPNQIVDGVLSVTLAK